MKFWKLQVNGNDFLLFYRNHKNVNKIDLCSVRMGAGAHGWIEVKIRGENIQCQIYGDQGEPSMFFYDGIRCCAYWYMKQYEQDHCTIVHEEVAYRLKSHHNLVTLEMDPLFHDLGNIRFHMEDALHFRLYQEEHLSDVQNYLEVYSHEYDKGNLHKIAMGRDDIGENLMRYSNHKVYISAPVYMIYEGNCRNWL